MNPRHALGLACATLALPGLSAGQTTQPICALHLHDRSTGSCLSASSQPTLGDLYPLSVHLNVDPAGRVGVGTLTPQADLDVAGHLRCVSPDNIGYAFESYASNAAGGAVAAAFHTQGSAGLGVLAYALSSTGYTTGAWALAASPNGVGLRAQHSSSLGTAAALEALTYSEASGANAILATIETINPGCNAAAVRGKVYGVGGCGIGVEGYHAGDGWGGSFIAGDAGIGCRGWAKSGVGTAVMAAGDLAVTGVKGFVQPHPSDPTREVRFVSLEGNESGTYFRGSGRVVDGRAVIEVPEEFRWVTEQDGLTVQVTVVGAPARAWVERKDLERIVVRADADVDFDYFVNGVRRGFGDVDIVRANRSFVPRFRDEPFGLDLPDGARRILVQNGILNADGTPNELTAARAGWMLAERPADDGPRPLCEPPPPTAPSGGPR